ncbi:MAG: recombinase family protein [Deltaproteobacteria bacterium]|nr:recombinase family protein [Deltaproteobacteria bacterium]
MAKPETRTRRCAIYTRKSSEEGLEQDFNSLDAQREACEAYIRSQKSEGWKLVETGYNDGGYSGGTMERPALKRLLDDIEQGRVQTVVVYKVDRLTRSLSDFAKIVDVLDAQQVSFVSVTQQFNTTTSMGRLTLNMLLSFAQFEREVTGERIRDKIAASKRKGLWMGGLVPLGYEAEGRTLKIVESEANTVREIFRMYLELGSVRALKEAADRRRIRSKARPGKHNRIAGGRSFSRGALYHLLSNPVYIGRIPHKAESYEGQHPAIIDLETWDAVQKQMASQAPARRTSTRTTMQHPLMGRLFDEKGVPLVPTSTIKGGKRYRYYVSRDLQTAGDNEGERSGPRWRLSAHEIEKTVEKSVRSLFANSLHLARLARAAKVKENLLPELLSRAQRCDRDLLRSIRRVDLDKGQLIIEVGLSELMKDLDASLRHAIPFEMRKRGNEVRLVIAEDGSWVSDLPVDSVLIKAISRARVWFDDLSSGRSSSLLEIAKAEAISDRYIGQLMPLAFLAPEVVAQIVAGSQPSNLTTEMLRRAPRLPLNWIDHRSLIKVNVG